MSHDENTGKTGPLASATAYKSSFRRACGGLGLKTAAVVAAVRWIVVLTFGCCHDDQSETPRARMV